MYCYGLNVHASVKSVLWSLNSQWGCPWRWDVSYEVRAFLGALTAFRKRHRGACFPWLPSPACDKISGHLQARKQVLTTYQSNSISSQSSQPSRTERWALPQADIVGTDWNVWHQLVSGAELLACWWGWMVGEAQLLEQLIGVWL